MRVPARRVLAPGPDVWRTVPGCRYPVRTAHPFPPEVQLDPCAAGHARIARHVVRPARLRRASARGRAGTLVSEGISTIPQAGDDVGAAVRPREGATAVDRHGGHGGRAHAPGPAILVSDENRRRRIRAVPRSD